MNVITNTLRKCMALEGKMIAKLKSDYDPDTFMRIVETEDRDVSIAIYGKGEMKIAGIGGGGYLKSEIKWKVIDAFSQIITALQENEE
jgi:TATA-box binding protein (TBP) (component of TFIID and TFIIIB)